MSVAAVIIGAGGHAGVILEAVTASGAYHVVALTDPHPSTKTVLGVEVVGGDDMLPGLRARGVAVAVLGVGDNVLRQKLGLRLRELGFTLPPIVHPAAFVSPSARIGAGAVVMARAVVGTQSEVAEFAIINTGAILDHDNSIGVAAHIAPGCSLAGRVRIGARALLGIGCVVRPEIVIGDDVIVGAGSAVVADVPAGTCVTGVPAKPLQSRGAAGR